MELLGHLHSTLRWFVLLVALYAIYKAFIGMNDKSRFTNADDKAGLVFTILIDTQLVLGLLLYFLGAFGIKTIQNMGMAAVMKDSYARFFAVEHITMMLIAIAVIHIGRSKSKNALTDLSKHKKAFWYYLVGLVLILASIPWPFRKGFAMLGWY